MADQDAHGHFVWFDLLTTDTAAAIEFYGKVTGWGTELWDGAGMDYTMWTNGGVPLGGVNVLSEEAASAGAPPHWMAYVAVADVDATMTKAESLGGKALYPATDIPNVGRFAILQDPSGAVLAPFAPATPGPPPAGDVGQMSWHELMADDYAAAGSFYGELFGWQTMEDMDMGPAGIYRMYGIGDRMLGGIMNKPEGMHAAWLYYVRVADLDAAVEVVKGNGGQILNGPMDVPGGDRIAQCMDPQGAAFALHEAAAGASAE